MSSYYDSASPSEIAGIVGRDLRTRRLSMNLAQETVSDRSGVSLSTLKRIEAKGAGSLKDVVSIAWALGLPDVFNKLIPSAPPASIDEIIKANTRIASPRRRASSRST